MAERGEWHGPAGPVGLGLVELQPLGRPGEGPADPQYRGVHVDVGPVPAQRLPAAQPGGQHHPEQALQPRKPARGPLLIIEGEKDHTVPWAIAKAAYERQRRNPAVTEIVKMPNRGHSLTIDHGWREVAQTALDFVKRFA